MWAIIVWLLIGCLAFVLKFRALYLRKPDHPSLDMFNRNVSLGFRISVAFLPWRYKDLWEKNGYAYDTAAIIIGIFDGLLFVLWEIIRAFI